MYEKIAQLLKQWCCDDKAQSILEALHTLELHGDTTAAVGINAAVEGASLTMGTDLLDEVYRLIHLAQETVFHAFAIEVTDDFYLRNVILDGLAHLDNFDVPDALLQMTENCDDPVETFADIIEFVTTVSAETIHTVLKYVSPSLINKISGYCQPKFDAQAVAILPTDTLWLARVKQFVKRYPVAIASRMVTDDMAHIGTRIDTLLSLTKMELAMLEPGGPQQAAYELVGICLISDLGATLTSPVVKTYSDVLFSDIDFITHLTNAIDSALTGVPDNGRT